jgi:hypothetical protein
VAFEALQIDINAEGAGHDQAYPWEDLYNAESSMETIVDSMGHFDEDQNKNLELYKRIAEFLLPNGRDTWETIHTKETALRTFCYALPNTATQELNEGNRDMARQLVELLSQCVERDPNMSPPRQLDELKKELIAPSPS